MEQHTKFHLLKIHVIMPAKLHVKLDTPSIQELNIITLTNTDTDPDLIKCITNCLLMIIGQIKTL
jgi:hypothetical protein